MRRAEWGGWGAGLGRTRTKACFHPGKSPLPLGVTGHRPPAPGTSLPGAPGVQVLAQRLQRTGSQLASRGTWPEPSMRGPPRAWCRPQRHGEHATHGALPRGPAPSAPGASSLPPPRHQGQTHGSCVREPPSATRQVLREPGPHRGRTCLPGAPSADASQKPEQVNKAAEAAWVRRQVTSRGMAVGPQAARSPGPSRLGLLSPAAEPDAKGHKEKTGLASSVKANGRNCHLVRAGEGRRAGRKEGRERDGG